MIFKKIANILTELFYILLNFAKIKSFFRPNFAKLNKKQVIFAIVKNLPLREISHFFLSAIF